MPPPGSAGSLPAGGEASPRDSVAYEEKGGAVVRYALEVRIAPEITSVLLIKRHFTEIVSKV